MSSSCTVVYTLIFNAFELCKRVHTAKYTYMLKILIFTRSNKVSGSWIFVSLLFNLFFFFCSKLEMVLMNIVNLTLIISQDFFVSS